MKTADILKLAKGGFTAEQIDMIAEMMEQNAKGGADPEKNPEPEQDKPDQVEPEKKPEPEKPDPFAALNQRFDDLEKRLNAKNIRDDEQPDQPIDTPESILASIINPPKMAK